MDNLWEFMCLEMEGGIARAKYGKGIGVARSGGLAINN